MRVEFETELDARYLGLELWQLLARFSCAILEPTHTTYIEVPRGFVSDLDSIPRWPFTYWIVKGRFVWSAVLHDYLYRLRTARAWADAVMNAAMLTEATRRVPHATACEARKATACRRLVYSGVRAGGWVEYRRAPRPIDWAPAWAPKL